MSEYFDQRDIKNSEKIEQILTNDLPDYCREYFVGISMNTTTLTRLNYAYDIRTFFRYLVNKIYRFKGKSTKEIMSDLNIKENTLKFHNKNLYSKLGVTSRKRLLEVYKTIKANEDNVVG